ncbi:MAG: hypothetical protein FWF49_02080 [Oscillospiraceae bacterium]|nr:hypothetical protein [Oscillospiraceae bacterium]
MAACIFLSVPAWLLVIALPNKTQHEELLQTLRQAAGKGAGQAPPDAAGQTAAERTDMLPLS